MKLAGGCGRAADEDGDEMGRAWVERQPWWQERRPRWSSRPKPDLPYVRSAYPSSRRPLMHSRYVP